MVDAAMSNNFLYDENARSGFEFEDEDDSVSSGFLYEDTFIPRAIQQQEPLYVESSGEEEERLNAINEVHAPQAVREQEAHDLSDEYERAFFTDFLVTRVQSHNQQVQLYRNYDAYDQETANMRGEGPVRLLFFDSYGMRALALKAAFQNPRSSHTNEHVYIVPHNRWVFKLTKVNEHAVHSALRRAVPELVAPVLQRWDLAYLNGHFYRVKIMPRGRVGVPQVDNAAILQYDKEHMSALLRLNDRLGELLGERNFRLGADTASAKNRAFIEGGWKMFDFDNEMKNVEVGSIEVPTWMRALCEDDHFLDLDALAEDDWWHEDVLALKKPKDATFDDDQQQLSAREKRSRRRTGDEGVSFGLQVRVEKDAREYPVQVAKAVWGRGLFAERDIAVGEVVAEFGGVLVDKFELVKSLPWRAAQRVKSYLVDLRSGNNAGLLSMGERGLYTNDERVGNQGVGLFCNFSGDANCERAVLLDEKRGTVRVILRAKRAIKRDEELFSSYSGAYNARLKQLNKLF